MKTKGEIGSLIRVVDVQFGSYKVGDLGLITEFATGGGYNSCWVLFFNPITPEGDRMAYLFAREYEVVNVEDV